MTGGAGYIGSHAVLRLLKDSYRVTIVVCPSSFQRPIHESSFRMCDNHGIFQQDNLSRGNMGAVKALQELFPEPGRLQFIYADLGDGAAVSWIISFRSCFNFMTYLLF